MKSHCLLFPSLKEETDANKTRVAIGNEKLAEISSISWKCKQLCLFLFIVCQIGKLSLCFKENEKFAFKGRRETDYPVSLIVMECLDSNTKIFTSWEITDEPFEWNAQGGFVYVGVFHSCASSPQTVFPAWAEVSY